MGIVLSKISTIPGKKYEEPLHDPVCVCRFEKTLSAEHLIDSGDSARPVMDCIEKFPHDSFSIAE